VALDPSCGQQKQMTVTYGQCGVVSSTASSLSIRWNSSSAPYTSVYTVECNCSHGVPRDVVVVTTYNTSATIENLRASTTYAFSVTQYNSFGTQIGLYVCYVSTAGSLTSTAVYNSTSMMMMMTLTTMTKTTITTTAAILCI